MAAMPPPPSAGRMTTWFWWPECFPSDSSRRCISGSWRRTPQKKGREEKKHVIRQSIWEVGMPWMMSSHSHCFTAISIHVVLGNSNQRHAKSFDSTLGLYLRKILFEVEKYLYDKINVTPLLRKIAKVHPHKRHTLQLQKTKKVVRFEDMRNCL